LLLHLFAGGTRIDGDDDALPYGERWEFVLWHHVHSIDAEGKEYAHDKE